MKITTFYQLNRTLGLGAASRSYGVIMCERVCRRLVRIHILLQERRGVQTTTFALTRRPATEALSNGWRLRAHATEINRTTQYREKYREFFL